MSGEPEFLRIGDAEDSSFENSLGKAGSSSGGSSSTSTKVIQEGGPPLVGIPANVASNLHLNYFSAMHLVSDNNGSSSIQDMSNHSNTEQTLFVSERPQASVEVILEDSFNHAEVMSNSASASMCSPTHMIDGKDQELEDFLLKYPNKRSDFICDVCQMKFTSFSNLRRHKLSHFGVRPFECRVCRRRFYRKDHMLEHVVRQHSKQRPFRCPFCNKNFAGRPHLKTHLSTEHNGISCEKRLLEMDETDVKGLIHHGESHPGNSSSSSTCTHSHSMEQIENLSHQATQESAMDLTEVSQNFCFPTPDINPGIPTSSELSLSDSCRRVNPTPYMVRAGPSLLTMPSCSSTNVDSLPSFSLDTSPPTTVSSSKNVELSGPLREDCNRTVPLCTSSSVKQEPIDEIIVDDSQSTCSSTIQPSSTMENNEMLDCRRNPEINNNNNHGDDETSPDSLLNRSSSSAGSERLERASDQVHKENEFSMEFKPVRQHCGEQTYTHKLQMSGENSGEGKVSTSSVGPSGRHASEDDEEVMNSCDRKPPPMFKMQPTLLSCCRAGLSEGSTHSCPYCSITFPDQTLYLLHRSLHAHDNPWKCNMCGMLCSDKYDFHSHIVTQAHR